MSAPAPVVVVEYDAGWPALFAALAAPVRDAVGPLGARVEHVGSTAVPGLVAKPLIDVDVVVDSPDDVRPAIEALAALGYEHEGDLGVPGREAFRRPPGAIPHHLYVVVAGSRPHLDHVVFRDHLRAHPETAAEYAALKRELARRHATDREAYTRAKADFIAALLTRGRPG